MNIEKLNEREKEIVHECLKASVDGPFFPDWEFSTLFGLKREEVKVIAEKWPDVDFNDQDVKVAVNNSMNNLLGYPHREEKSWDKYVSVKQDIVFDILRKFRECEEGENTSHFRFLE